MGGWPSAFSAWLPGHECPLAPSRLRRSRATASPSSVGARMPSPRSLALSGLVALAGLSLAAPAVAARSVTVRVEAPQQVQAGVTIGLSFDVVDADVPVAGLQARVMVDGRAAEVGGVVPLRGARPLDPVAVGTSGADVGVYGARPLRNGRIAAVGVFPEVQGRIQVRVGR